MNSQIKSHYLKNLNNFFSSEDKTKKLFEKQIENYDNAQMSVFLLNHIHICRTCNVIIINNRSTFRFYLSNFCFQSS